MSDMSDIALIFFKMLVPKFKEVYLKDKGFENRLIESVNVNELIQNNTKGDSFSLFEEN